MPITSIGSYAATMQEFATHWGNVNTNIAPDILKLASGYALADFTTDRTAIIASIAGEQVPRNTLQGASTDRDLKRKAIKSRLIQFISAVKTLLPGTIYINMLPNVPSPTASEGTFMRPIDDMASVWSRINTDTIAGFTPPLLLAGGYTLVNFTADRTAMRAAFAAVNAAEENLQAYQLTRDALLLAAKGRMKQYRTAVKYKLMPGNVLLNNIPLLTPKYTGPVPKALSVSGKWNPVTNQAELVWTDPNPITLIERYEIRTAPPPTYKTKAESTLDSVGNDIHHYETTNGLTIPGETALFRIYAITIGGREKASTTIKIIRP